jgi:UDP-N-acetylmuramoyl-L-alanyl-D-glutamate--2,6-diaminopimelate ligase
MKVIGVTGTNGKTTVTYLIEAILKEARAPCGVIGTVNCRFKDEIIPSKNTTPGPLELQSMLAKMLAAGCKYAVTEVSSHALDQARTCGIDFQGAIFTNLTHDHLDYHKTKAQYFQCKTRLFSGLSRGALAVVNNDDAYGRKIRDLTSAEVVSYGINEKADFVARAIKLRPQRTTFKIVTAKAGIEISSPLIGRHNVYNILAAFSWAYKAGVPPPAIKAALENFSAVPGRLERIDSKRGFSVYVDYAHTQDALKNILTALREFSPQRIIVVFGCGGDRDRNKRPKMGRVVSELSDYTIVTSDNPRREDPLEIIGHISEGIRKNNYCIIPERRDAIKMSLALARKDDIVVVAGKGHEDYQILKDKVLHFDDRRVVRECLESMSL